jgi:hypothetical protein
MPYQQIESKPLLFWVVSQNLPGIFRLHKMADSVCLQCSSLFLLPTHPSFSHFNTPCPSALTPLVICLSYGCHLKLESEIQVPPPTLESNFGGEEIWLHLELEVFG